MNDLFRIWWKGICWFTTIGIMFWFIVMPLIPVYGLIRVWPEANEKIMDEGITGFPLMIGAASSSELRSGTAGTYWQKERERSYVIVPESFQSFEIITYVERQGSDVDGIGNEIVRSRSLIPLLILWILSGVFMICKVRRWWK